MEDRENDRNDKMNEGYGGNGGQRPGSSLLSHHIRSRSFLPSFTSLYAPQAGASDASATRREV